MQNFSYKYKSVMEAILQYLAPKVANQSISIYAAPMSLHYYLKHINPYFDYAFSYKKNLFIIMDTGMDYIVGEVTEKAQSEERQGMGFNIIAAISSFCAKDVQRTKSGATRRRMPVTLWT